MLEKEATSMGLQPFQEYVARKCGSKLAHVDAVISILFEEMRNDLLSGVEIILGNFGTIAVFQLSSREHRDLRTGEMTLSSGKKTIRFQLKRKFYRFLLDRLDRKKTLSPIDKT